jgi:hypothetical protein
MANRIFNIENGGLNLCSTTGNSFDTIENNNVLSHYSLKICFSTKNYKNISEMELCTQILADDAKGMSNKAKIICLVKSMPTSPKNSVATRG